ncbi:hypothetical protein [Natrinema marinum]|uniref:hypothetical protein n=1 Tax=Natrinema marinum TaxID=2961598 RepID=UPI0020C84E25|nr:hypothetical protein [Natrinema marinum]
MSDEFEWVHRDRGVLTERDREILVGESGGDLSQNALNQRFYNIRNRIENSILDFHLLAQHLPLTDLRQLFEPAYDWSRERRHLNEHGRTSTHPDLSPFLLSWMSLFEFFSYGMYAGGKNETQVLMKGLVENGLERGFRQYQHENRQTYREIDVSLEFNYGNPMLRNNYLRNIHNDLSSDPSKIAEQIMTLRRQRKIPYRVASRWIDEYVRTPSLE